MPDFPSVNSADIERTMAAARLARRNAYAPYVPFKVGAALLTQDGQIVSGCNMQTPSWEGATCAECVAIANAVTQGFANDRLDFIRMICVSTQAAASDAPLTDISPCGMCRQIISDFCTPAACTVVLDDGQTGRVFPLEQLLGHGFRLPFHPAPRLRLKCDALEQKVAGAATAEQLLEVARATRRNADTHVQNDRAESAVIQTTDGRAFCGVTVDNSCTALTIRALRSAIGRAIVAGAAQGGTPFVSRAALLIPRLAETNERALRHAVSPALVAEFFRDDADITIQLEEAAPFTLTASSLFGWTARIA